jgi:hypothetical protein
MRYQPQNDLIDPDVPTPEQLIKGPEGDPHAPDESYTFDESGRTVRRPNSEAKAKADDDAPKRWVMPVAVLSSVLCVGLTVWNVSRLIAGPPKPPAPSTFQVKQALYMGVMKVESYRRSHGVTPENLQDTDLPAPPYTYHRVNPTAYTLALASNGTTLEYDSGIPMDKFFGSPKDMLTAGGSK